MRPAYPSHLSGRSGGGEASEAVNPAGAARIPQQQRVSGGVSPSSSLQRVQDASRHGPQPSHSGQAAPGRSADAAAACRSCRGSQLPMDRTGSFRCALLVHASRRRRPIELLVRKEFRLTVCASRRCHYRPAGTAGPQIKQTKAAPRPCARSGAAAVRAGVGPRMRLPTRRAHPCRRGCVRRRSSGRCGRG